MAIQIQGNSGTVGEIDLNHRAQRVSPRPLDHGTGGVFRASVQLGLMAAGLAANSEVVQFRWTDPTKIAIIERIMFDGLGSVAAFAAGVVSFRLTICRGWSADGSGGAALTTTNNAVKLRTSHASSAVGAIRHSTTGALTAGTKTIEPVDVGIMIGSVTATAGTLISGQAMIDVMSGGHPIVLTQNEGFIIRAVVPATGTWNAGFTIHWTEATAY